MNAPRGRKARIAALSATALVLGAGVATAATQLREGAKPAPKPLASAVQEALTAPAVDGVSADVKLTSRLLPEGSLALPASLLNGVTGHLAAADGRARLDVTTAVGDVQVAWDGSTVRAYVEPLGKVYRLELPRDAAPSGSSGTSTPGLTELERGLDRLASVANVSGATPDTVAGQPAYTVRISPKHDTGLVGAAELSWDAEHGVPLRAAVYAAGDERPVLELEATDVRYGGVPAADLAFDAPSSVPVVDLGQAVADKAGDVAKAAGEIRADVTGVDAVAARLPFELKAPDTLVGLKRTDVRLIEGDGEGTAVVTYGSGLGRLVVVERRGGDGIAGLAGALLPRVSIEGATGAELATALGTGLTVERDGVSYILAGSLPPAAAEAAARELLR